MRTLIKRILQLNSKKLFINIGISILFSFLFVSMFPSIKDIGIDLEELLAAYPPAMKEAFGINSSIFTEFSSFVGAEYFSLMFPIITSLFAISLGVSAISKEIESGSLYVLLSQPLSRAKIYIGKYISGIILIFILVYTSILSIKALAWGYNIEWAMDSVWAISHLSMLFTTAVFSISFLASSIFSNASKANSIGLAIVFGGYGLNLAAKLQESVEWLKYVSVFNYYDSTEVLAGNGIDIWNVIFFISVILVSFIAGLVVFKKRDLAV